MSTTFSGNKYSVGAQSYAFLTIKKNSERFGKVSGLQIRILTEIDDPPLTILLCIPETTQLSQFTCTH